VPSRPDLRTNRMNSEKAPCDHEPTQVALGRQRGIWPVYDNDVKTGIAETRPATPGRVAYFTLSPVTEADSTERAGKRFG
jgi:hypothetical protein